MSEATASPCEAGTAPCSAKKTEQSPPSIVLYDTPEISEADLIIAGGQ